MSHPVQLYKYDSDFYSVEKDTESFFASHFNPKENPDFSYWLNFHSLQDKESIYTLCDRLLIDKTLQESLFVRTKRVRIEEYANYVFFSIVSALPKENSKSYDLRKEQISFIIGDNYLISFQEKSSDHFPEVRDRIVKKRGRIRYKSTDYLLYCLLDAIIDNYSEVVDEIGSSIAYLDKLVLRNPKSEMLQKVEWEKRKLLDLRKIVYPMRELMGQLNRVENRMIIEDNIQYFNGLKDTCSGLLEEIEAQKQMLDGISNLYYAIQGQRMNQIMKVLTIISVIFIPLTFIVGVYGMNFRYMPELNWRYGYFIVWGIMLLTTICLILVFWRKGWLKKNN